MSFLQELAFSHQYIPHGHCYLWQSELVWLHVVSDILTAISYYSIPLVLLYFLRQRKDVPFRRIFLLFIFFILTCGTTHVMAVWTLWNPDYWLSGGIKALAALVSWYALFELIPVLPLALALPSPTALAELNQKLEAEIEERKQAQARVQQLNVDLEQRIQARTADLQHSNQKLEAEIAERKQTAIALEKAKESAEIASRAKSEFLANMSHELRTPLNSILGFSQLMSHDAQLTLAQRENLSIIGRSGKHLLELINDILEMAKIEAGHAVLHEASFDLHELLDNMIQALAIQAKSKGFHLFYEPAPDLPQYVYADERKLRQVLVNLLGNAIKYTEEGQVVLRVKTKPLAASGERKQHERPVALQVEISDTGPGIAPDELDCLFSAFEQTETGLKSQQGTGLGLPISRDLIQVMGGELFVDSTLHHGTTFTFVIPLCLSEAVDVHQSSQPGKRIIGLAPAQPIYRILIAEDQYESRKLMVDMLTPLGFAVKAAENGQATLDLWKSWKPHLIWMDMRMPVMNGFEATQKIKSRTEGQSTAIIALTASALEKDKRRVLAAGCDDFVRKPFQQSTIFEKLSKYLGVRYIYEDLPQALPHSAELELTPDSLKVMPPEWTKQIYQAATRARANTILALLEQVPEEHATIINGLTTLVNNFQFSRIKAIAQV